MTQIVQKTENKNVIWNINLRARVGQTVTHNSIEYTNITGINTEPGVGSDWSATTIEVAPSQHVIKFNFASLILSTTINQWRTCDYASSVFDDAVRNNVTGANPVASVSVGAQQVYKTGVVTKIILKSIRSGADLNLDAKFHIGKFEKPDGETGYLNEVIVAQETFIESSASFGTSFYKEMTITNANVTEGDFLYFAVANNTTTATTLLGFEATLIIE